MPPPRSTERRVLHCALITPSIETAAHGKGFLGATLQGDGLVPSKAAETRQLVASLRSARHFSTMPTTQLIRDRQTDWRRPRLTNRRHFQALLAALLRDVEL